MNLETTIGSPFRNVGQVLNISAPNVPLQEGGLGGQGRAIGSQTNHVPHMTGLVATVFTGYVHPPSLTKEYKDRVAYAMSVTMPKRKGAKEKDDALFQFAGRFKLLVPDATVDEQKAAAWAWHERAVRNDLLEEGEHREQTWFEFAQAWPAVYTYEKRHLFDECLARVREDPTAIPIEAEQYEQLPFREFIGASAIMQMVRGDNDIFVTVEAAHEALGTNVSAINKWFGQPKKKRPGRLVVDGWVRITFEGVPYQPKNPYIKERGGKARMFRYIGPRPIFRGHRVAMPKGGVK